MQGMIEAIRAIARDEDQRLSHARIGVVTSVHGAGDAPDHACTVRLRETGLVLPRVPMAVGLLGSASLPQEDDLVVVLFVEGDLHAPIVVGRLYTDTVEPPPHGPGEVVIALPERESEPDKQLIVRLATPGDGTRALSIALGGDVAVAVDIDDGGVSVKVGDTALTLTQSGSSDGAVTLSAGDAAITLSQGGDVTIETSGKLTLSAREVEIAGDATVKVAGQTIKLN